MAYKITVPASITEQTIDLELSGVTFTVSGTTPVPPPDIPNIPPVVNAGTSFDIQLPTNSIILTGSASDTDGSISAYEWSKISGPAASISSPNQPSTQVTGLVEGTYVFQLKVFDNDNASSTSTVSGVVRAAVVVPPTDPSYQLVYSNGFDKTADLDPQGHNQKGNGYIDTAVYKTGPGSFRSRPSNVSSGIRSEIQLEDLTPAEGAVEYDVKYNVLVANDCHSFQWHPATSGASACPGLWHRSGTLYITFKLPSSTPEKVVFKPALNVWYTIRHEFKRSTGSDGYWRVYVDGVLKATQTGRTMYDNGGWLKVGFNGWGSNATSSDIHYDNLKIYRKV